MRWYILRTLLHKEVLRHWANRGGIVLALLLVVMSMLLSYFGTADPRSAALGNVQHCFIDYWEDGPWIQFLRRHVPDDLRKQITFRPNNRVSTDRQGNIIYPFNCGAIQVRTLEREDHRPHYLVWIWYPAGDKAGVAPYEAWFWRETHNFIQQESLQALGKVSPEARAALPDPNIKAMWSSLHGELDPKAWMAAFLVISAIFIVCIYLLPSLTCEERERGILLAQALSPATPEEILAAKFLFYPAVGIVLGAVIAGTYKLEVLKMPFFWLALAVAATGSVGIGLTISSLARTQRAASMGSLCYMMVVAVVLFICQQNNIIGLPYLALEYYCPRMLHAALSDTVNRFHWYHLVGAAVLTFGWSALATELFRRRGWQ